MNTYLLEEILGDLAFDPIVTHFVFEQNMKLIRKQYEDANKALENYLRKTNKFD